ncbi:MAG: hypothetical protein P1Q69_04060 [Candidatus Thorarchaeota archaeon]|nr:hypothetical protein [Candidatus Thorarchaeota archaeon]
MPKDDDSEVYSKLSHSAKAVLKILQRVEQNQAPDLFQEDPELQELRRWVSTYRGGIYTKTLRRLRTLVSRGFVQIITQGDLLGIIKEIWEQNISRLTETELNVLEGLLQSPDLSMKELAKHIKITYNRTRRALDHLKSTGVLRREGRVDAASLGLDRLLIIQTNPTGVVNSPYVTRALYVDGSTRRVFLKLLIPSRHRNAFMGTIKTIRSLSDSTKVYALSAGLPRFGRAYYSYSKRKFEFDKLHFRLMLRAGGMDDLTLGEFNVGAIKFPNRFNSSETKIIESLIDDFDLTAQEIAKNTGLSESTTFRKRAKIVNSGIVRPRPKIAIPNLSDRVCGIFGGEAAATIIPAWSQLPCTTTSMITNLEDASEKKIIFTTALPAGSARDLLDVIQSEKSKIDDIEVWEVAAGAKNNLPVSALYDTDRKQWEFDYSFLDVRSFSICRNEASRTDIPLDLS